MSFIVEIITNPNVIDTTRTSCLAFWPPDCAPNCPGLSFTSTNAQAIQLQLLLHVHKLC